MLGGDVSAALPPMRAQAESNMLDSCELQKRGKRTLDEETGEAVSEWETYWSGPCRVRTATDTVFPVRSGGERVDLEDPVLALPVSAPEPLVGHRAVVASMPDRPLYVTGVRVGSQLVRRRVQVALALEAER